MGLNRSYSSKSMRCIVTYWRVILLSVWLSIESNQNRGKSLLKKSKLNFLQNWNKSADKKLQVIWAMSRSRASSRTSSRHSDRHRCSRSGAKLRKKTFRILGDIHLGSIYSAILIFKLDNNLVSLSLEKLRWYSPMWKIYFQLMTINWNSKSNLDCN